MIVNFSAKGDPLLFKDRLPVLISLYNFIPLNMMNLQKIAKSKLFKLFLSNIKRLRVVFVKYYLWRRKRRHIAIVPVELVDLIGMKEIKRKCREIKWQKGDINIGSYKISIV